MPDFDLAKARELVAQAREYGHLGITRDLTNALSSACEVIEEYRAFDADVALSQEEIDAPPSPAVQKAVAHFQALRAPSGALDAPVTITDEMVRRACAGYRAQVTYGPHERHSARIRAALEAALGGPHDATR